MTRELAEANYERFSRWIKEYRYWANIDRLSGHPIRAARWERLADIYEAALAGVASI